MSVVEEDAVESDPRLMFIYTCLTKSVKFKVEKWQKMMGNDVFKVMIMDFLSKSENNILLITLTSAGMLQPSTVFPAMSKTKSSYFIKKRPEPVTPENIRQVLIFGDVSPNPIENLAVCLEEVYMPLLSCPGNHKHWPAVVVTDVKRHMIDLRNLMYKIHGQISGQTLLPMPDGIAKVHQVEQQIITSGGKDVDLNLKSAIEGIIIKWVTQINDVVQEHASQVFKLFTYPIPQAEIDFWRFRVKNLKCIYNQLRDPRVKKMASILELTDSAYYPSFKNMFQSVISSLNEAKDIAKVMTPLEKYSNKVESLDFTEVSNYLPPLLHIVCLIWCNCKYYCISSKLVNLIKLICNLVIEQANKYLEPESLFQGEIQESNAKLVLVVKTINDFKETVENCRNRVLTMFPEGQEPIPWLFDPNLIFERLNAYLDRLIIIEGIFEIATEYYKLEKVEIGGLTGRNLGMKVSEIFDEFNTAYNVFASITYDPTDSQDISFLEDNQQYLEKVLDLDRRMAAICTLAFDQCHDCDSIFKMINVWGTMLDREIIKDEISPKYPHVIELLNEELDTIKVIYDKEVNFYKREGYITEDKNWPPVAGGILWIFKIRRRISHPFESFKFLENPITESPDALYALTKFDEMMTLLEWLEKDIFDKWVKEVPETCRISLNKTLLLVDPNDRVLSLNFDKELVAALREVRYLKLISKEGIPEDALLLHDSSETYFNYTFNLNLIIGWYNTIRQKSMPEEFLLVVEEVMIIDELIDEAQELLNWTSPDVWTCIEKIRDLVDVLAQRVLRAQANFKKIFELANTWKYIPLFQRKDNKKENLLAIYDAKEKVSKRYNELHTTGITIHKLLTENFRLFFNIPIREAPPPPILEEVEVDDFEGLLSPSQVKEEGIVEAVVEAATESAIESDVGVTDEETEILQVDDKVVLISSEDKERNEFVENVNDGAPVVADDLEPEAIAEIPIEELETEPQISQVNESRKSTLKEVVALKQIESPTKKEQKKSEEINEIPQKKAAKSKQQKSKGKKEKKKKKKKKTSQPPEDIIELTPSEELLQKIVIDDLKMEKWNTYLDMVDDNILKSLEAAIECSLAVFENEMDPEFTEAPLFEVSLELQGDYIAFVPSLDLNSENEETLYSLVYNLMDDIVHMGIIIPRVSNIRRSLTFMDVIVNYENIETMRLQTMNRVNEAATKAIDYAVIFYEEFCHLWLDDKKLFLQQFLKYGHNLSPEEEMLEGRVNEEGVLLLKENPPKLKQFQSQIDRYEELFKEVSKLKPQEVFFGWLSVNNKPFKQSLLNIVCQWGNMFKEHLSNHVINSLKELADFIEEADEGLSRPIVEGDYDGLISVMGYLMKVKDRQLVTDYMFEPLNEIIELLKGYDIDFPEETYVLLQDLPDRWNNTKKIAVAVKAGTMPLMQAEANTIRKRLILFEIRQNLYRDGFKKSAFYSWDCFEPYKVIDKYHNEVSELEDDMEKLIDQSSLFEVAVTEFKIVKYLRKELKMAKVLWDFILIIRAWINDWETTPWKKIDSETIDMELKKFAKEIRTLDKELRTWDIYAQLEATIKNMITALRAVTELQNPAIKDRHWKQLMETTKVKFVIDDRTVLSDLLALNLYKFEEEVKNIVDKSVKEMSMEKTLGELTHTWANMEFEYEVHPRTNCKVLKVSEELIEILEDNQVQLQNMMSSKFIAYFLEEVSDWQRKLSNADQVIHIWLEVQHTWMHLESIFIGSDDIRNQLPEDSKLFDHINKQFRVLLEDIAKTPNVVKATNKSNLYETLESLQSDLTKCEKALANYLEAKRLIYPRFYFVSSADLLDILSNGNQPEQVCRHLTKLYDSIAKLKFHTDQNNKNTKTARGMFAKDGEYVEFNSNCDCSGQVEKWLNNVTDSMRKSGRFYFSEAVVTYDEKPREQWVFDYPAQTALCGTQIWWTTEVNLAFSKLEEGYENALKDYQKKQITQLSTLISLLLADLTSGDRQKNYDHLYY
uniref:Dynein beta chain, ciliary-like n=1 Tax=Clastoptera arizonana TaxID=38151 RepID=A0A1B6BXH8_9HEMI